MTLVATGLYALATGIPGALPSGRALLAASASFALLAGLFLLLIRSYVISSQKTMRALAEEAGSREMSVRGGPTVTRPAEGHSEAASPPDLGRRLRELERERDDLLTLHRVTREMLRATSAREVLESLLRGVREDLGFPGTVLGFRDVNGDLVFEAPRGPEGPDVVRIGCADPGSVLARTLWDGEPVMLPSPNVASGSPGDRAVLGGNPAYLVPMTRTSGRACSDVRSCGNESCPAYDVADARCWRMEKRGAQCPGDPSVGEERTRCGRCEVFGGAAILVVRSRPAFSEIDRDGKGTVVALGNEAAAALELVERNETARKNAVTDGLTGLANHRAFYQALRRETARAKRYGHRVSLLMVDVDDFKGFNDRYGHLAGDDALQKIAGLLKGCVRANDVVARYGGEEFAVILPESTPGGARRLGERIRNAVEDHRFLETSDAGGRLTVSVGIYSTDRGAHAGEEWLVRFADEAAYQAKQSGKNRVVTKDDA